LVPLTIVAELHVAAKVDCSNGILRESVSFCRVGLSYKIDGAW